MDPWSIARAICIVWEGIDWEGKKDLPFKPRMKLQGKQEHRRDSVGKGI